MDKKAHGIVYHPVSLAYDAGTQTLNWARSYYFVDENGDKIDERDEIMFEITHAVRGKMPWSEVPQKVKDALIVIDQFTKQKIDEQEGLL